MPTYPRLDLDCAYHIYNRGNNREMVFRRAGDYSLFLNLCHKYVDAIAALYAYCFLGNHFHLALRTHSAVAQEQLWLENRHASNGSSGGIFRLQEPSQNLANLFTSYSMRHNLQYGRTGSVFEKPFRRIPVEDEAYLRNLIVYIHRNPETHGLVADFREWPFSSYHHFLVRDPEPAHAFILSLFGGADAFRQAHQVQPDEVLFHF